MNDRSATRSEFSLMPLVRQWLVFGAIILVVAVLAFMFRRRPEPTAGETKGQRTVSTLPTPPSIALEGGDVAVTRAVVEARKNVLADLRSSEKWGVLGEVLLAHEFSQEAAECFTVAFQLNAKDIRWPYLAGQSLRKFDLPQSRLWLERAVALSGNQPAALRLTLVEVLLELNQLDEAEKHLRDFLQSDLGNPRARLANARLLFLRGEPETCLSELQKLGAYMQQQKAYANRTKPLLLLMAECARRTGRTEQAESYRRMAGQQGEPIWEDPIYREVNQRQTGLKRFLKEADALFVKGDYDDSLKLLEQTRRDYPESIWAKIMLGRVLIRTGAPDSSYSDREQRLAQAEAILRSVLDQDAHSVEAMFRLGVALEYQGRVEEAMELYERAIQEKTDFTMAYFNLALCRYRRNDRDGAIQELQMAVRVQPDFVDGLTALGQWLVERGNYSDAETYLNSADRLKPQDARIRKLLGLARQGQSTR